MTVSPDLDPVCPFSVSPNKKLTGPLLSRIRPSSKRSFSSHQACLSDCSVETVMALVKEVTRSKDETIRAKEHTIKLLESFMDMTGANWAFYWPSLYWPMDTKRSEHYFYTWVIVRFLRRDMLSFWGVVYWMVECEPHSGLSVPHIAGSLVNIIFQIHQTT